jgi:low temperature requirement protein LtrA
MAMVFSIWWCYFDGVDAVGERFVRSREDARRFHIWSYAHLPFYLGIAVAGVGVEHIITTATAEPLHLPEVVILSAAVALVMLALGVIGATSRHQQGRRSAFVPHGIIAALTILLLQMSR